MDDLGPAPFISVPLYPNEIAPAGFKIVDVRRPVAHWIEQQPIHLWKPCDDVINAFSIYERFSISDELYTMIMLRWS